MQLSTSFVNGLIEKAKKLKKERKLSSLTEAKNQVIIDLNLPFNNWHHLYQSYKNTEHKKDHLFTTINNITQSETAKKYFLIGDKSRQIIFTQSLLQPEKPIAVFSKPEFKSLIEQLGGQIINGDNLHEYSFNIFDECFSVKEIYKNLSMCFLFSYEKTKIKNNSFAHSMVEQLLYDTQYNQDNFNIVEKFIATGQKRTLTSFKIWCKNANWKEILRDFSPETIERTDEIVECLLEYLSIAEESNRFNKNSFSLKKNKYFYLDLIATANHFFKDYFRKSSDSQESEVGPSMLFHRLLLALKEKMLSEEDEEKKKQWKEVISHYRHNNPPDTFKAFIMSFNRPSDFLRSLNSQQRPDWNEEQVLDWCDSYHFNEFSPFQKEVAKEVKAAVVHHFKKRTTAETTERRIIGFNGAVISFYYRYFYKKIKTHYQEHFPSHTPTMIINCDYLKEQKIDPTLSFTDFTNNDHCEEIFLSAHNHIKTNLIKRFYHFPENESLDYDDNIFSYRVVYCGGSQLITDPLFIDYLNNYIKLNQLYPKSIIDQWKKNDTVLYEKYKEQKFEKTININLVMKEELLNQKYENGQNYLLFDNFTAKRVTVTEK